MSTTLILLVNVIKNQLKLNKRTYHYVTWFFSHQIIQIKEKHLVMRPKKKALLGSEIAGLVLKTPRSHMGPMQDWLDTVLLWISYCETNN